MDIDTKNQLMSYGVEVIELETIDPHYRTRTFIQLDGMDYPWYDTLYEIPHLNDGEQFASPLTCVPGDARLDGVRAGLWNDITLYCNILYYTINSCSLWFTRIY
jgi:hypothetical protein